MRARPLFVLLALAGLAPVPAASAQYGDISDLKIIKPEDKEDVKRTPPPEGAVVLFDGKSLENWVRRGNARETAGWKLVDGGAMEVNGTRDIITKQRFAGPFKLHVEFRVPYMPKATGQGRGNSGVYVDGRYEVQVLDSYGLKTSDHDCGGIYSVAVPLKNACKAPTVWQSYDIEYSPPKSSDGKISEPGTITVYHNGEKIHDNVKLNKENTTAGMGDKELGGPPGTPGPILLQDHGNPVQYRNIWLLPRK